MKLLNSRKTWKRELATIMVLYMMYLGVVGSVGPLEILVWPFMFYVTAAFGMDGFSRQILPQTRGTNNGSSDR